METVLALGFDLFFRPKIDEAASKLGVAVVYAHASNASALARGAARVMADVSAPGVAEALAALRAADPTLPILACFPHVEEHRAAAVRALGGVAVTRGRFAQHLEEALGGSLR
ncbi:MAG TPA: hypothetical protein VM370_12740 [Candidatus Thermoplasmatota archaeon]|nr:hypothetical protein [Candidatus Thermoplasmatota archaeon]